MNAPRRCMAEVAPLETLRLLDALDEVMQVRLARIERGHDIAAELDAPEWEARDAAYHFIRRAHLGRTADERIRALAKAGGAIVTLLEVELERREQARRDAEAQPPLPL